MIFDPRGVREVEATRNLNNYKPYRLAQWKAVAKATAKKYHGAFYSNEPVTGHPITKSLMGRKKRANELPRTWYPANWLAVEAE